jgi:8-oxo-dGTP pyrophosphatase MutT (NUDIX family)
VGVGRFFAAVGALLWNPADGRYLVLRRSDEKDFGAGIWECVTGRVDQGEGFTEALHREVAEELGIEVQIDLVLGTSHFYRGEARPENEMLMVLYRCSVEDSGMIRTSWEHAEHRWITAEEAKNLFPEQYWLARLIRRAEAVRGMMPEELLAYHRAEGFEL